MCMYIYIYTHQNRGLHPTCISGGGNGECQDGSSLGLEAQALGLRGSQITAGAVTIRIRFKP